MKCPKCASPIAVPAPAFEVVDEPAEERAPKSRKPVVRAEPDGGDDRPRARKRREVEEDGDDRPRAKRGRAGAGGKKRPVFALVAAAALVLVAGVGAAVWLLRPKAPDAAPGGGGDTAAPPGTAPAENLKALTPRLRFVADLKKEPSDRNEPQALLLNADGSRLAVSSSQKTQVWALAAEARPLHTVPGLASGISDDGTLLTGYLTPDAVVELETGRPTKQGFVGVTFDGINGSLTTPTARLSWTRSGDWRTAAPFRIYHTELPSKKILPPLDGGDDNRVDHAPPVKQGKELVYGLPRANKVRVFDFEARSVVREFALANPREFRGPAGTNPTWNCFRVSPDGKWVAVVRVTLARDPDPTEIFDATGAVAATIPPRAVSDLAGTFVPGRDVYVGPVRDAKVTNSASGELLAYDVKKRAFAAVLRGGHKSQPFHLAASADGKVLVTADTGGEVCVWDLAQLP